MPGKSNAELFKMEAIWMQALEDQGHTLINRVASPGAKYH
jgi:hypothetical protein